MKKEESLQFMRERLRQQQPTAWAGELQSRRAPGVVRRFLVELEQDETHVFEHVEAGFTVHCLHGGVWIAQEDEQDGAIVITGETHRAQREGAMHLYALTPVALEIEFEDWVTVH